MRQVPAGYLGSASAARVAGVTIRELQWMRERGYITHTHHKHTALYNEREILSIALYHQLRRSAWPSRVRAKVERIMAAIERAAVPPDLVLLLFEPHAIHGGRPEQYKMFRLASFLLAEEGQERALFERAANHAGGVRVLDLAKMRAAIAREIRAAENPTTRAAVA